MIENVLNIERCWKGLDVFSGFEWFSFQEQYVGGLIMEARNIHRSLSLLHAELKPLIWSMHCKYVSKSEGNGCFRNIMLRIGENDVDTDGLACFFDSFGRIQDVFSFFSLFLILRNLNTKMDRLAQSARLLSVNTTYVNFVPSVWISEPF